MPKITVGRNDVLRILQFTRMHKCRWFVAKDEGAYVGASRGKDCNIIFYFDGCNPNTPFDEWYNTSKKLFGGDDFGETLPLDWLTHVEKDKTILSLTVIVDPANITAEFNRK